jgi:hypothetical protein
VIVGSFLDIPTMGKSWQRTSRLCNRTTPQSAALRLARQGVSAVVSPSTLWELWEIEWLEQVNAGTLVERAEAINAAQHVGWTTHLELRRLEVAEFGSLIRVNHREASCTTNVPRVCLFLPFEQQLTVSNVHLEASLVTVGLPTDSIRIAVGEDGHAFRRPGRTTNAGQVTLVHLWPGIVANLPTYVTYVNEGASSTISADVRDYYDELLLPDSVAVRDCGFPFYWQARAVVVVRSVVGHVPKKNECS